MYKHILCLPDGQEICSGAGKNPVLLSVTVSQSVNSGQELTLGSACGNMLEAEILGQFSCTPGEPLRLYG